VALLAQVTTSTPSTTDTSKRHVYVHLLVNKKLCLFVTSNPTEAPKACAASAALCCVKRAVSTDGSVSTLSQCTLSLGTGAPVTQHLPFNLPGTPQARVDRPKKCVSRNPHPRCLLFWVSELAASVFEQQQLCITTTTPGQLPLSSTTAKCHSSARKRHKRNPIQSCNSTKHHIEQWCLAALLFVLTVLCTAAAQALGQLRSCATAGTHSGATSCLRTLGAWRLYNSL
jgi:hypothetical protein